VVGTAGHIDHGKSALIEALCGAHPDRWQEEKERGITIDLGYAEFAWPDGFEVGFVDVPGHERLVRKMVAGATGMGAAMLVVACDDGVMPQTREHFEVLQLLGLDHGVVVLTKADLADEETLELVQADVEELIAGTSWESASLVPVSAHTGQGIEELKAAVRQLAEQARARETADPAALRIPIQRSFALHGAGTVATGVCASGRVAEGQTVEIQPGAHKSRVRRVHVHGRPSEEGIPGLRTALNLPEVESAQVSRGVVVCEPGTVRSGALLRASFQPLAGQQLPKHGSPVMVLSGTAAINGKLWLPPEGMGQAEGRDEWLVDIELEEQMALVPGQRLLFRRPSPASNMGAGQFLRFAERRLRRRDEVERAALLNLLSALSVPVELAAKLLEQPGMGERSVEEVASMLGWRRDAALEILQQAAQAGSVREMSQGRFLGMGRAGELAREIQGVLAHWRGKNPHRLQIPVARLRERLGKEKFASLQRLSDGELQVLGLDKRPGLHWGMDGVSVADDFQADANQALQSLHSTGLIPTAWDDFAEQRGWSAEHFKAIIEYLEDRQEVLRVEAEMAFSLHSVEQLRDMVVEQLQGSGMDIPALRDRFGTTRKYLMPLLEYMDTRGVTARRGGNRILRDPQAPLV